MMLYEKTTFSNFAGNRNHVSHSAAVEGSEVRWDMWMRWDWI
jgi:hypothetical protein